MANDAYRRLVQNFAAIQDLNSAANTLDWYARTKAPKAAQPGLGSQIATLRKQAHELLVNPRSADDLAAATACEPWEAANLREMRRRHRLATALPADFVEAQVLAASRAQLVWERSRPEADFAAFLPALREFLGHVRERARIQGRALGLSPYDALLEAHDPGRRNADITRMFGELETVLPGIVDQVRGGPKPAGPTGKKRKLKRVARRMMTMIGLPATHARLDTSSHPFTAGEPEDIRITTRYSGAPGETLMAVLHECGHALYVAGLPAAHRRQPVGAARGMTAHESQSLLIEMFACRSRGFAVHYARLLRDEFGEEGAWDPDRLHKVLTHVEPGVTRVEADEVTYPLHIVIRHRCETAMLDGTLDPADLPDAFNDAMVALLGIRPTNPREGCLQDPHWTLVEGWAYFPTYALGALMAAQLAETMWAVLPDLNGDLARGDFAPLAKWLRENVHSRGCFDSSADALLEHATGRPLDTGAFMRHLERRYLCRRS
ncbi:MAG: carboxypeptidase M32 [Rhodospirillales bacterium]|nr:carboxypeptidase M32 [Rhodospirillales bacterium]